MNSKTFAAGFTAVAALAAASGAFAHARPRMPPCLPLATPLFAGLRRIFLVQSEQIEPLVETAARAVDDEDGSALSQNRVLDRTARCDGDPAAGGHPGACPPDVAPIAAGDLDGIFERFR